MTKVIVSENQSIITFNNIPASYENSFICNIFDETADAGICIDMITQSPATSDEISMGFTFADGDMPKALAIIKKHDKDGVSQPLVSCGNVKITVKSQEMVEGAGFASKIFSVLKTLDILPLLVATGLDEISLLVYESSSVDLERELKKVFA